MWTYVTKKLTSNTPIARTFHLKESLDPDANPPTLQWELGSRSSLPVTPDVLKVLPEQWRFNPYCVLRVFSPYHNYPGMPSFKDAVLDGVITSPVEREKTLR